MLSPDRALLGASRPGARLLHCADKTIDLAAPLVMGVLNVTPDSFSDGGRFPDSAAAVAYGVRLAEEGAAFIDVGGESTRPGAPPVTAAEELARVMPVIEGLRARTEAVISIDTTKPEVMRAAAAAGAGLINDVRALGEPGGVEAAVDSGCAVCLVHMQGEPRTMQRAPSYTDVTREVASFLESRVRACRAAGIDSARILIDPGFGFGKTLEHNLQLLRTLPALAALGPPLLVGLSRKSMLGTLTGRTAGERLAGSLTLAVLAVQGGARIVRAHDVAATVDALKVVAAVQAGG
jgi:dihydropteroate synthase